jgi:hypothetical protein
MMIKSRRVRWVGYMADKGEITNTYKILVRKSEGKNHLRDPGIEGRKILNYILKKQDKRVWIRFMWLMTGTIG